MVAPSESTFDLRHFRDDSSRSSLAAGTNMIARSASCPLTSSLAAATNYNVRTVRVAKGAPVVAVCRGKTSGVCSCGEPSTSSKSRC